MKNIFRKKKNAKQGFTIIEVFVGITVLLIGIVGPMTLVNRNMQTARFSHDQITAYYLAQEAIEVVRQVRDSNILNERHWLDDIGNGCSNGCVVNGSLTGQNSNKIRECTPAAADKTCENQKPLYVSGSGYTHTRNSSPANISRYVELEPLGSGDRVIVTVTVEFDAGRYSQIYTTNSSINNWAPER